jgi:hypothetical protein
MIGSFSGAAKTATSETGEVSLKNLMWIDGLRPLVTGSPASVQVAIAVRDAQDNTSRTFGTPVSRTTRTGICDFREQGRYISAQMTVTGGFDRAIGIDVDATDGDGT